MKQYLELLDKILAEGVEKESARLNMPNTIGISNGIIRMDLSEGFPLLTTKKMHWKGIVHELLWFLRGETNIKYLVDNGVSIWSPDAYRWYLNYAAKNTNENTGQNSIMFKNEDGSFRVYSQEEFINNIKLNNLGSFEYEPGLYYKLGDLGKVYGYQWRNQNGVDQVAKVLKSLKETPYSRYHIINGWNAKNFPEMALPPCHLLYQFICRPKTIGDSINVEGKIEGKKYVMCGANMVKEICLNRAGKTVFVLDLNMYQRSCDTALGNPYNIASMSLLLKLFAKTCNMEEGIATWIGGDTHLYVNHIENAKMQAKRIPSKLPTLNIT